jgi:AcrR family transcriptional regulator
MESRSPHEELGGEDARATGAREAAEPLRRASRDEDDVERPLGDRLPATERILRATARGLVERGAASLSMQEVADSAGVSKGLIHYHYHDKAALLVRVVEWMSESAVARQGDVLDGADAATAVDALWRWLGDELARGELRALTELAHDPVPTVRAAVLDASVRRREAATETIEQLFDVLGQSPRVPAAMLADTFVAFADGLAVQSALMPDADRRVAFDVFALAILGLGE